MHFSRPSSSFSRLAFRFVLVSSGITNRILSDSTDLYLPVERRNQTFRKGDTHFRRVHISFGKWFRSEKLTWSQLVDFFFVIIFFFFKKTRDLRPPSTALGKRSIKFPGTSTCRDLLSMEISFRLVCYVLYLLMISCLLLLLLLLFRFS